MAHASKKAKLLLLTDWIVKNDDWSFLREMRALGHQCETVGVEITRIYGSKLKKIVYLWCGYLLIALKGFLKRKDFDFVIAYQGVAGLFYAFLRQMTFNRKPRLVLMAFFFKKRKNRLYNKLRYWFTRLALRGVDKVVCYSSREATYYNEIFGCGKQKFVFVPFGVNMSRLDEMAAKKKADNGYVFSAGSSNRDYRTLFDSVTDLDVKVVVFAKKYNVAGMSIPENVEMMYDVYGDEFYKYLLEARLVVVPLDDPELSSGQMVLLESMGVGKPVVASKVWGTVDYVQDGLDARLVNVGDKDAMHAAIKELLESDDKTAEFGVKAREVVREKFTVAQMAARVSETLN